MPKREWEKPEPRSVRIAINVTPAEEKRLDQLAEQVPTPRAIYIREVALGHDLKSAPRAATMDSIRYARVIGALDEAGAGIKLIVDLLRDLEHPRAQEMDLLHSQINMALAEIRKALGLP